MVQIYGLRFKSNRPGVSGISGIAAHLWRENNKIFESFTAEKIWFEVPEDDFIK
jgi:hypothetical protein